MQPALEFRHILLSAPKLTARAAFSAQSRMMAAVPADTSARLALLGHDVRAAVSDVIGGLQLLPREGLAPEAHLQLERVRASAELLSRLMDEGLAAVLGEDNVASAPTDNIPLTGLIHDIEARWCGRAREKGLTFTASTARNAPHVLTLNRIALDRILSNILSNAIKYSDVGVVALHVEITPSNRLRLAVTDDGPGFSAEALARLFDLGGRPHDNEVPGQGLGLHIARGMAGRLGGAITVENRTTGGACIALELPPTSWTTPTAPPAALPDLSHVKVLVADDSATNQAIIGRMLDRMGASYVIADDGVAALDWLSRETFDLALVDIEMPRLSGLDVIHQLRVGAYAHKNMPVIAITAYVLQSNRDAIYAAGADAILVKPLAGIETFGATISKLLNHPAIPAEEAAMSAAAAQDDTSTRLERLVDAAGPDLGQELLSRLSADLRSVEHGLIEGFAAGAAEQIHSCTHILIALAGTAGAEELLALARALNHTAQTGDITTGKATMRRALDLLKRLITQTDDLRLRRGGN